MIPSIPSIARIRGMGRRRTLFDPDALAYFTAVKAAGSDVSQTNRRAISDFVKGLKSDASQVPGLSNWDCIYDLLLGIGPDSHLGVFVPLKGSTAFTNGGFTNADYSPKSGLKGGASKYIASSRLASTISASDLHLAVDASDLDASASSGMAFTADAALTSSSHLCLHNSGGRKGLAAHTYTGYIVNAANLGDSFECLVATTSDDLRYFQNGVQYGSAFTTVRTGLPTGSIDLFCFSYGTSTTKTRSNYSLMRMRLYSVGRAVNPGTFYSRWATCKAAMQNPFSFLRPDGVSRYLRPDGVSTFKRF